MEHAGLNARLVGVVAYVQMNDTDEGFDSSTDIVRYAINFVVKRLEDQYNDGKPFPAPRALRRGRGASRLDVPHRCVKECAV